MEAAFWSNVHGAPCQIQDRILREMAGELFARAELNCCRTTDGGHALRGDVKDSMSGSGLGVVVEPREPFDLRPALPSQRRQHT
jgi:hypothetical protein